MKYKKLEKIICRGQLPGSKEGLYCPLCKQDESNKACPMYHPVKYVKLIEDNGVELYERKEKKI